MTRRTRKDDWFTAALSRLERVFVSGTPLDPARPSEVVTLRLFGHWPDPKGKFGPFVDGLPPRYHLMLGLVTVEVERGVDVEAFEITPKLRGIASALARLLDTRIDIVVFARELTNQQRQQGLFPFKLVRDRASDAVMIQDAEYASELNRMRGEDGHPTPPVKRNNRSENDHIKAWTQGCVTPKIAVNDIDAIIHLRHRTQCSRIFLEAKRPHEEPLGTWLPRPGDAVNYRLMQSVSASNPDIIDFTCAYAAPDADEEQTWTEQQREQVGKLSVFTLTTCGRTRLAGKRYEIAANTGPEAVGQLLALLQDLIDHPELCTGTDWTSPRQDEWPHLVSG